MASPTHNVFFVQDIGQEKPFWRQIGVAWSHQSGKGFQMKLDLLPADFSAGDIVALAATEKPEEQAQAA